jgi:hypothetical protein
MKNYFLKNLRASRIAWLLAFIHSDLAHLTEIVPGLHNGDLWPDYTDSIETSHDHIVHSTNYPFTVGSLLFDDTLGLEKFPADDEWFRLTISPLPSSSCGDVESLFVEPAKAVQDNYLETHDPPQSADAPCQPFVNLPFAYVLFDS